MLLLYVLCNSQFVDSYCFLLLKFDTSFCLLVTSLNPADVMSTKELKLHKFDRVLIVRLPSLDSRLLTSYTQPSSPFNSHTIRSLVTVISFSCHSLLAT